MEVCVCIFIYLCYWIIKNKKSKKEEKNKNACLYLFQGSFLQWDGKRTKKDLIFWLDHGVEVQTCTEVVFLKSDEKTKFLKLL